jgi:ribonuclease HIII
LRGTPIALRSPRGHDVSLTLPVGASITVKEMASQLIATSARVIVDRVRVLDVLA